MGLCIFLAGFSLLFDVVERLIYRLEADIALELAKRSALLPKAVGGVISLNLSANDRGCVKTSHYVFAMRYSRYVRFSHSLVQKQIFAFGHCGPMAVGSLRFFLICPNAIGAVIRPSSKTPELAGNFL
jgi:hypothetical protein